MHLKLIRYSSNTESTLGLLFDVTNREVKFLCYTLEDEFRITKLMEETRIPAGTFEIKLRTEGSHHERYRRKFSAFHRGMLHLQDVPNFKWILFHIGNTDADTAGCILVGDKTQQNITLPGRIESSTDAYVRVYQHIVKGFDRDGRVFIEVEDYDTPIIRG